MPNIKASRNRTIDTSIEDGQGYLARCISVESPLSDINSILDSTILGDTFFVMPLLPKESFDIVVADPPYNLTKDYNGTTFAKKSKEEYADYTRKWLSLVQPLLKPNGSIYVCCDWETSMVIGSVLDEQFYIRNRISWQREKGRGAKSNWKNGMEDIWFATKGNNYTFNLEAVKIRKKVIAPYRIDGCPKDWSETEKGNFRDTCPSNFWDDITIPFWSMPENTAHPTQKPEKLIAKILLASTNKGDKVFDPFLGSGTTSVVAKKLGRHYLGIEKDPQYCLWSEQRLELVDTDTDIQGYVDGIFWERNSLPDQNSKTTKVKKKSAVSQSEVEQFCLDL